MPKLIVTYNIKDFPRSSLTPYSITAQGPSAFLKDLYVAAPAMVMQTLEDQAAAIGKSMPYLLSRLQINAPAFVEMIRRRALEQSDEINQSARSDWLDTTDQSNPLHQEVCIAPKRPRGFRAND